MNIKDSDPKQIPGSKNESQSNNPEINMTGLSLQFLLEDLRKRENILNLQNDLILSISQVHSLSETLRICLDSALKISGLDCGGIYLFDNDGGLELVHAKGLSSSFLDAAKYYSPQSKNVRVLDAGRPAYLDYTSPNLPFKKIAHNENLKALAVLPVFQKNKIIGCLNIASRTIDKIPDHIKLSIESIASVIGILIGRAVAEERLHESEENYRQAEKMAKLGHWRRHLSDDFAFWSVGTHEIFGTDPESFIPTEENFYRAVHPSDLPPFMAAIETALKNRTPIDVEFRIIRPDGNIITVHFHAEIKTDRQSKDMLVGTIQDVTHHKTIERELKEQATRLEELNTAMKVLIEHRENEQEQLERGITENINKLVIPYIEKAAKILRKIDNNPLLEIALSNLESITRPFSKKLSIEKLSPTELQVADLVKNGKATKEIAQIMSISANTVMTHRYNIRKKLGLLRGKKNLYSYLQSFY